MHVSVTSLIYWCIFLTTVNNQEKSVSVMVGKNVQPNHWYFYVSVTKIYAFKIFQINVHTINIEKFVEYDQWSSAFRTCNENSGFCLIPIIIIIDRCTVDRRKVYVL